MSVAQHISGKTAALASLRQRIRQMERLGGAKPEAGLPTLNPPVLKVLAPIDALWPEGGLPLGCLHEARSDDSPAGAAALTAFAAAIGGRLGMVLWCARTRDVHGAGIYGPGLARVGLSPARLLAVTARSDAVLLGVMEEGLRHSLLACVVGEVDKLDLTASRRLQLAAEKSGVTALVLRTSSRRAETEPIAAAGRWRITPLPSGEHIIAEAGAARWRLELLQSRNGATGAWTVEAPDAQGHLHFSSPLDHGHAAPAHAPEQSGQRRATG